jgi:soluble lytic murein transglycosylase-like protein
MYSHLNVTPDHIAKIESNGDPNAVNPKTGARGLMQVMPAVAANPGFGIAPARDDSPDEYVRVGRQLYTALKAKYNDPFVAAAAYNWGPGNVDKWLATGGDWHKLPKETYHYVQKLFTTAMHGAGS